MTVYAGFPAALNVNLLRRVSWLVAGTVARGEDGTGSGSATAKGDLGQPQADLQFVRLYRALGVRQDAEWGRLMA